jgi:flavin-dependent dehydrogenase
MHHSEFSVVVVGGGPSGSAAAIKCIQKGLDTAIIEGEPNPFTQNRPGESLHPGIEPILEELGVEEITHSMNFLRHEGIWIEWDDGQKFSRFGSDTNGPWLGYQLWRKEFDQMLVEKAEAMGAKVFRPCRAIRPLIEKENVVGVETTMGVVRSKYLIDGSGANHWLARNMGLMIKKFSPTLIAWYGYVEGSCPVRDHAPAIVADSEGWTWTAHVHDKIYQWTKLSFDSKKRLNSDYLPEEFQKRGMKSLSTVKSSDVTWRLVPECAESGYFIVGDAAFVLDPLSSHGVLKALMSGIMTGHLIDKFFRGGQNPNHLSQAYREWIWNWHTSDLSHLVSFYRKHPKPPSWLGGFPSSEQ